MKNDLNIEKIMAHVRYFFLEKKFNGPRASVLALLLIPLVAYPLVLSDYENTATVSSSGDQFEENVDNNDSTVQVTPNAEIILVKEVVNDDGGLLTLTDFNIATSAGSLVFDAGTSSGSTTTYTSEKIFMPAGTFSLTEINVDGYKPGLWSCTAGVLNNNSHDNGELELTIGQSAVCTIVNDDIAPQLTLVKNVVNSNGGGLIASNFALAIGAGVATSGTSQSVAANTAITIAETPVAGYTAPGGWSCVDANNITTTGLPTAGAASGVDVTLLPGSDVTCSITNVDLPASLTLVKNVINDHGGDLTVGAFELSIGTGSALSGVAQIVPANAAIEISELEVAGYSAAGGWSCLDANGITTTGLPSAGAADGVDVTLLPGSDVTCTIVNDDIEPTLTLVKNVTNDHGGDLTVSAFPLSIGIDPATSGVAQAVTANTAIEIAELEMPGYSAVGGWSCLDANGITTTGLPTAGAAGGVDVTLLPGSDVTCTIVNDDIEPSLTLVKNVVNNNGGALTVADFALSIGPDPATSGISQLVTANTDIEIKEVEIPGYTAAGGWSCVDANSITTTGLPTAGAAGGVDVNLLPGSDVTCSITNADAPASLTLVKSVTNDHGGELTVGDFELSIGIDPAISGVAQIVPANAAIEIAEDEVDGYLAGGWSCIDANSITTTGLPTAGAASGVDVTLLPGSDVTCSIVNDDIEPTLTLVKNVENNNGGSLTVASFELSIGGGAATSGVAQPVVANTDIEISEVEIAGYSAAGGWSCVDANNITTTGLPTAGAADGVDVNLLPGSDVTCSITNSDEPATLTLVKNIVNDHGGDLTLSNFELSIGIDPAISGVAQTIPANAAIEIAEVEVAGYAAVGGWSCKDANSITTTGLPTAGAAAGVDVTLLPGSDVTCSIVNDDIEPTLTLVKNVVNTNGGTLTIADFALSIGGGAATSGVAQPVLANSDIEIKEVEIAGYSAAGGWSCVDANSITTTGLPTAGAADGVDVNILPGSDVTCSITNSDEPASLTLVKNIVNDHGGALGVSDFLLSIGPDPATSGLAQTIPANAAIEIAEVPVAGYSAVGGWSCVDANSVTTTGLPTAGAAAGVDVTLLPGSDVTCTIVNDDIQPTLTLVKNVVNDNGGALGVDDFLLSMGGAPATSGMSQLVMANTDIAIGETPVTGYSAAGGWACTDANGITTTGLPTAGAAAGVDVNILPGSDVTCEITNNDLGIDLSIAKVVSDSTPNIGDVITFTLTVENAGPDIATNATVSDIVLPGFTYEAGSISGGTSNNDTDPTVGGLSWTLASVPVGSPIVLSFDVKVNAP